MWLKFVKKKGVTTVAERLAISKATVWVWLRGKGEHLPRDRQKKALVLWADGEFGYADFFKKVRIKK